MLLLLLLILHPCCFLWGVSGATCTSFFSVLVLLQSEDCQTVFKERAPFFKSLQLQFGGSRQPQSRRYNETVKTLLTLYVSTDVAPHQQPGDQLHHANSALQRCLLNVNSAGAYPNLRFVELNPDKLLSGLDASAGSLALEILNWPSTFEHAVIRGDIYRLLIALRDGATYMDADVILLGPPSRPHFKRAFVPLTLFAAPKTAKKAYSENTENSLVADMERAMAGDILSLDNRERLFSVSGRFNLEFTNAAFCLPRDTLRGLLALQLDRMIQASEHEKDKEWGHFGASVFRAYFLNASTTSGRDLTAGDSVAFYATNPPKTFAPAELRSLAKRYDMRLLHLSGYAYRKGIPREDLSSFDALAETLLADYATYSTPSLLDPPLSPPPPPPSSPFRCNGLFTTVDGMLAGTAYKKRGDCCLEMKAAYFRSLLVEATRQAANASSSLSVFVNSETQYSRCGACFASLFRTLQTNPAVSVFTIVNPLDMEEARTNAQAQDWLRIAIKRGTLQLKEYSPSTLLQEAGLPLEDTGVVLATVADLMRSFSALQFTRSAGAAYSVNETFVSNVQALEVLEALTVLSLAAKHAQTFVALNVLLLDTSASMYMEPFIALATKPSARFEAAAFVTSHAFCAPPQVLRAAAQSALATHVQRSHTRDRAIVELQELQARRRQEMQAALDAKMRKQAKARSQSQRGQWMTSAVLPAVNETTLPRYWEEETDVEDHEAIAAQSLQLAWFRALNSPASDTVRLLTLCSPHHTAVPALMADARVLQAKLAVVSSALVERALRQRVHRQVLAQRGVKIVQGKVVRVEPFTLAECGDEVVAELILAIRAAQGG